MFAPTTPPPSVNRLMRGITQTMSREEQCRHLQLQIMQRMNLREDEMGEALQAGGFRLALDNPQEFQQYLKDCGGEKEMTDACATIANFMIGFEQRMADKERDKEQENQQLDSQQPQSQTSVEATAALPPAPAQLNHYTSDNNDEESKSFWQKIKGFFVDLARRVFGSVGNVIDFICHFFLAPLLFDNKNQCANGMN